MKEATGELSMTTITIIAIIAIAGILTFLAPMISDFVNKSWRNLSNQKYTYVNVVCDDVAM